ncbi:MAG: AAA family ATPase [Acidobacteria bacterium]|nr:AAA family ATPase [Acidobacteriota bacterium]
MHIKRLEIENIKSHASAVFEFSLGTTAITGENGAGKTTIIEAIAWALFDLLNYKKDDFVSRGAKKGSVRVTFESGLDGRDYLVYRDTGTGYYVTDPALKTRIADKKEEVTRFLWQHLGVEPGTDLESLFTHAIGVPQGTFTAIFLATATERKRTFDTLLKVEEYRRSAEELLKTQRFIDNRIRDIRERIARSEGELSMADEVKKEHEELSGAISSLETESRSLADEIKETEKVLIHFDKQADGLLSAQKKVESAKAETDRASLILKQSEEELRRSLDASDRLEALRADSERYVGAVKQLEMLEKDRSERDRLRGELSKIEASSSKVHAEDKHLRQRLDEIQNSRSEIEMLRPQVSEQETLEKRISELREESAKIKTALRQKESLDQKLVALREAFTKNRDALTEATEKAAEAKDLSGQLERETEIASELARLRATLERDEKFQSEVRNGLCPILSERCLNLKEGQTLEGFLSTQFDELKESIKTLEVEEKALSVRVKALRNAETFQAKIDPLTERSREIKEEGKRLREEYDALQRQAENADKAAAELSEAEKRLASLGDPRGRIMLLEKELVREPEIKTSLSSVEAEIKDLSATTKRLSDELGKYTDLDGQWATAARSRDETAEANKQFLISEVAARRLSELEAAHELAKTTAVNAGEKLLIAEKEFDTLKGEYDRERHLAARAELLEVQKKHAGLSVRLETARQRLAELAKAISAIEEKRKELVAELAERERLEKTLETTVFIRDTLKEAAPLVARNYVRHVSVEANQLFRDIAGNAEATLKWNDDYGIVLEEGGYERPFANLSGGEQMAAALSVRLALLKQLSDIRIAFFDEPTTNMDAERRENLAMQIGRITHFNQLFVISHDDTFEGYMDNEITVERI